MAGVGAILGKLAGTRVAALTGLQGDLADGGVTEDRLKALGATAAAAGGVALFHVVGVTPEAPSLESIVASGTKPMQVAVTTDDVRAERKRLSTSTTDVIDAVSLGTPHFSVSEFAALAAAIGEGEPFADSVGVVRVQIGVLLHSGEGPPPRSSCWVDLIHPASVGAANKICSGQSHRGQ